MFVMLGKILFKLLSFSFLISEYFQPSLSLHQEIPIASLEYSNYQVELMLNRDELKPKNLDEVRQNRDELKLKNRDDGKQKRDELSKLKREGLNKKHAALKLKNLVAPNPKARDDLIQKHEDHASHRRFAQHRHHVEETADKPATNGTKMKYLIFILKFILTT